LANIDANFILALIGEKVNKKPMKISVPHKADRKEGQWVIFEYGAMKYAESAEVR